RGAVHPAIMVAIAVAPGLLADHRAGTPAHPTHRPSAHIVFYGSSSMYNRLKRSLAIVCLAMPLPFSVLAAGTATIQGSNGDQFTLEYDGSQMRLQSDKQRNVHLIANGSSIYAVT